MRLSSGNRGDRAMGNYAERHRERGRGRGLLWGAAHALDLGGVLLAEKEWAGFEADAEALRGDWMVALHGADRVLHASETSEAE
ncbi:MAG TPA: hypothetical protein VHG08_22825 [Longimicrobium sp.]|nr:hypothetical protein [Longimicrobium sp.]